MTLSSVEPTPSLVDKFSGMSTTLVEALLQQLGIFGRCSGATSVNAKRFCGRVFTVQFLPFGPPDGRTPNGTIDDYLADVPSGYVIALDNRGDKGSIVWNAALSQAAVDSGIAGVVIDGCSDGSAAPAALPIYCTGSIASQVSRGVRVEGANLPIAVGGIRIECDDIAIGDEDGVVIIPKDYVRAVLEAAKNATTFSGT